jgi:WD40 repeat protein
MSSTRKMRFGFPAVAVLVLVVSFFLVNCGGGGGGSSSGGGGGVTSISTGTQGAQAASSSTQGAGMAQGSGTTFRNLGNVGLSATGTGAPEFRPSKAFEASPAMQKVMRSSEKFSKSRSVAKASNAMKRAAGVMKARISSAQTVTSGSGACIDSGSFAYNLTFDDVAGTFNGDIIFTNCREDDAEFDGTLNLSLAASGQTVTITETLGRAGAEFTMSDYGPGYSPLLATTTMSGFSIGITVTGDASSVTMIMAGSGAMSIHDNINSEDYTLTFSNGFSDSMVISVPAGAASTSMSVSLTTNGNFSESWSTTSGSQSVAASFSNLKLDITATSAYEDVGLSGSFSVDFTPDSCLEGTFTFATSLLIRYDHAQGHAVQGTITINGVTTVTYNSSGMITVTTAGTSVTYNSDYELEQVCPVQTLDESEPPATNTPAQTSSIVKTELVSRSTDSTVTGTNAASEWPVISADGRFVAFVSSTANLAPGASGLKRQIFVHDRQTHTTELVSVNAAGAEGNGDSFAPTISSDGRYVAFESYAANLIVGDGNVLRDVFIRDRQALTTIRVSVGAGGVEANSESYQPSISADGRFVAFSSSASNLAPGVSSTSTVNVYVRDLTGGTTTLVSADANGTGVGGSLPAISADGSRIAFYSFASTLVAGDANNVWDIFLYDSAANPKISIMSVSSAGVQRNQGNESISRIVAPAISADGDVVAFSTTASNLVSGDTNSLQDVFLHQVSTGVTIRASEGTGGVQTTGGDSPVGQGERIALSSDGTWVAFTTAATNISVGGSNVVIHNNVTGETKALTADTGFFSGSKGPAISGDGRFVAFMSGLKLDPRFTSTGVFVQDTLLP